VSRLLDIEKVIDNVKATMIIEGLLPSEDSLDITRLFLMNKISSDEAIIKIKKLYGF